MTVFFYTGGCQCGAVRYRIEGEIVHPHLCHCRMCQKAAGNYFMPLGGVFWRNFTFTRGEPAWFQSSHLVRRGFCRDCGTPMFYDGVGDHVSVMLGTLDDPTAVKPVMQSGTDRKMPWFRELDGLDVQPDTEEERAWLAMIGETVYQHPDHETETWPPEDAS